MTVGKGTAYGEPGALPDEGVVVRSDAEAAEVVRAARRAGRPVPPLGLLAGDLCRTLGGPGDEGRLRGPDAVTFAVDLGVAVLDGEADVFVAHLVARRWGWRGHAAVVMNAEWLGPLDLGPRAHPGDGLLDLTEGRLPLRDRLQARRRARTGSHLPHPGLTTARRRSHRLQLDGAVPVHLDGVRRGRASSIEVHVEPDALTVVV